MIISNGRELATMIENHIGNKMILEHDGAVQYSYIFDNFTFGEDPMRFHFGDRDTENYELSIFKNNIRSFKEDGDYITLELNNDDTILISDLEDCRWCIIDENNQYVHADSIKKIGKEYGYTSYPRVERGYTTYTGVQAALKLLELHNKFGNLNHTFKIIEY